MKIQGVRLQGTKLVPSGAAAVVDSDTYFNLVALLLPGNGTNGAQNNIFLDSSTNNFTVTRNGTPTQGTFSPFSQTGWSGYFDRTGQLDVPESAISGVGSSNFSIECWVYATTQTNTFAQGLVSYGVFGSTSGTSYISFQLSSSGNLAVAYATGAELNLSDPSLFPINQWVHAVVCRSGSTLSLFVNGTRVATTTTSATVGSSGDVLAIGGQWFADASTRQLQGYISNVRIVNGSSAYDATSSTITVPTAPLTAITNTSLLTCQSNRFIDNSSNAFAITVNGNTAVQAFAPFDPTQTYSNTVVGGSEYMVRTDYLTVPSNAAIKTFTGDFTIESWVYPLTTSGAAGGGGGAFIDARTNGSSAAPWIFGYGGYVAGSGFILTYFDGSDRTSSLRMPVNQWSHAAMTRQGSTLRFFINGVVDPTTYSVGGTITGGTNPLFVTNTKDYSLNSSWGSEGYWADFRIVNGTAVYTSSFTPPTAPLTAITNTTLLLNFTNGGISDATSKNNLQTVGGAAISTAQSKFGGSSMAFDGTGDYLLLPNPQTQNFVYGTGNFTIEFWFYMSALAGSGNFYVLYDGRPSATTGAYVNLAINNATPESYVNGATVITGSALSANTWYHFAYARSGSSTKMFINGTQVGSTYTDNTNYINAANRPVIGTNGFSIGSSNFNGYINDLRITRGLARYTANFTAPTQAFPTQ